MNSTYRQQTCMYSTKRSLRRQREEQKVLIYIEHYSVCPLVGFGTPPTLLPQASVPSPPDQRVGGGGVHSPAAKGVEESQFRRLEKSLALCLLCGEEFFSDEQSPTFYLWAGLCLWLVYGICSLYFHDNV